jgi:hypothetical protein
LFGAAAAGSLWQRLKQMPQELVRAVPSVADIL